MREDARCNATDDRGLFFHSLACVCSLRDCSNEALCQTNNWIPDALRLKALIKELDPLGGRPVSANQNGWVGPNTPLDLQGFDYSTSNYDAWHNEANWIPDISSETSSAVSDRGEYVTNDTAGHVSGYDTNAPGWGQTAEGAWGGIGISNGQGILTRAFMSGGECCCRLCPRLPSVGISPAAAHAPMLLACNRSCRLDVDRCVGVVHHGPVARGKEARFEAAPSLGFLLLLVPAAGWDYRGEPTPTSWPTVRQGQLVPVDACPPRCGTRSHTRPLRAACRPTATSASSTCAVRRD